MKTAEDYPKKWGVINGFCYAPTDYLQMIKTDLFISLPISAISHIQNHYRIYEHRDPLVEEMIMLDILFSNAKYEAEQSKKLFLSDLKTDDEEIKAALKDLNEKLCALDPGRSGPLPFEDVLTTPGRYIRSIMPGRCPGSLRLRFWNKENDLRPPDFSHKTQSFSIDKSQICFDITTFEEKMYIEKGDYIQIENSESLRDILSHLKEDGVNFKSSVIRENIIEEILSHGRHCDIHVPYSLPHAACMGRGDILLLCKERHSQKICSALDENGISFKLAGRKKTKGNLTFFGNINKLTLRSSMIYDLTRPCQNRLISAVIKSNMLKAQPSCCFEELTPYKKLTEYTSFFKDKKELFVSSVKSTLTSSPYKNGMAQAVIAAATAIASGNGRNNIKLAHSITCPKDQDPSLLLAHLLGIYRAETELCLFNEDDLIRISEDSKEAESRTVAITKAVKKKKCNSGTLWLIAPEQKNDTLSFENIRKTFSYVSELLDKLPSSRAAALDTSGIGTGMNKDLPCQSNANFIGGFLVLTNASLIGAPGIILQKIGYIDSQEDV